MTHDPAGIRWMWRSFDELTLDDLHDLLALRQNVFIMEQQCLFLDIDGLDRRARHLLGRDSGNVLRAYLRVLPPGERYAEPSIGRVVVDSPMRHTGLGPLLMHEGIRACGAWYPGQGIRIMAQHYLERFYSRCGFVTVGEPFDEDGILHVIMVRDPETRVS